MSLEKHRKLADILQRRTSAGEIDWQETFPNLFQVSFKDNSVQIDMNVHEDGESATYSISLLNSEGEVADRFTDGDLDKDQFGTERHFWYQALGDLYSMARRRARGADKVLDDILKEVDDDVPF